MSKLPWNQRFFSSTRGRILTLLRRSNRTVEELAQALELTDNAIRAHLATLERDGLVVQRGLRRGGGKPSYIYELSAEAEYLFPKLYGRVLNELLSVLHEHMSEEELEDTLRATGRRIASRWNIPQEDLQVRLQASVEVLNELGGMAELEKVQGHYCISGYSCPLASVVPDHPEACHLAEALLTELVGAPVKEECQQGEHPHCRFVLP